MKFTKIMKFTTLAEVNEFLRTVQECKGEVWLESPQGDRFVLKSVFSHYLAMSALLTEHGDQLELFCQFAEDETKFYEYFSKHPGVL